MFHANIIVVGKVYRPLVRNWDDGEKMAAQMGGELSSLTKSRKSDLTHKYAKRLFDKMN